MTKGIYRQSLRCALAKQNLEIGCKVLKDTSTNLYANTHIPKAFPFLIAAISQKDGQGRRERAFISHKGGAYFTLQFSPSANHPPQRYTLLAGVAATCALSPIEVGLKWPNDIFLDGKKLGGILCSCKMLQNKTIINCGIGINVSNDVSSLAATNLAKYDIDIFTLIAKVTRSFMDLLNKSWDEIFTLYKQYSIVLGRDIVVTSDKASYTARAVDLTPCGNLIIKKKDGECCSIYSEDVSIIPH